MSTLARLAICSLSIVATTPLVAPIAAHAAPQLCWDATHDGGALYLDFATAAATDDAGNLVVGGESYDGVGGADMLVLKLDRGEGGVLWSRRVPAADGNDMALSTIARDPAGDFIVAGYVRACPG
jgi:hypothetical protein